MNRSTRPQRRGAIRRAARLGSAFVLGSGLVITATPAPVSAATFVVTTTLDVTATDGQLSLREAVAAANASAGADTIVLTAGAAYTLTECAAGELRLAEGALLTIQGNGSSIQQTCDARRLFAIDDFLTGARLDLRDLVLLGGPNAASVVIEGAAIHAGSLGGVSLDGVEITGFSAGPGGSVIHTGQVHGMSPSGFHMVDSDIHHNAGTAVTGDNTSTWIQSSQIRFNTGGFNAADAWPAVIQNSSFTDNDFTGFSSSAQGLLLQTFTVIDSTFARNGRVGFRCSFCGPVSITGSTVTDNGLTASGDRLGGIELRIGRPGFGAQLTATITNTTVTGNATNRTDRAGGITVLAAGPAEPAALSPVTTISGSTVNGNTSPGSGGGIRLVAGPASITNTGISGNSAGVDGGGLYSAVPEGPFDLTLSGVQMDGNAAVRNGGAIAVEDTLALSVTDSTLSANTSGLRGGGVWSRVMSLAITGSRIGSNDAVEGGGVYAVTDGLAVSRSTIDANTAVGDGGGALVDVAGFATFVQSTLSNNDAGKGGAIAQVGGAVDLLHVTAVGNVAIEGSDVWQPSPSPLSIAASVLVSPGSCLALSTPLTSRSVFADSTCGVDATSTVTASPVVGPLAANGGTTPTHLPLPGSPVLGRVPVASCGGPTDQRGVARPQGAACESGSVEVAEPAAPILGTAGADRLVGTAGPDVIRALGGKDLVRAGAGDDDVDGGDGADTLYGGAGRDLLVGGAGPDTLYGGAGDDRLIGGDGPDVLDGGPGADVLIGGPGPDVLYVGPGDTANGGQGKDECWFPGARRPVDC